MDNVAVSRQKRPNKGNKENAQPAYGSKSFIKRDPTSVAPFQLKSNKKEETFAKNGPLKAKAKQADTRPASGDALKKVKTILKSEKGAVAAAVVKCQTHSQAFLAEQVATQKMAPKPAAAAPSSKSAPGMYKGKIVQSKIGSIWKSSSTMGGADAKPSVPKAEIQRVGNVTQSRSKSVADLARNGTKKPALPRSKSVTDAPSQVSKPAVIKRPAGVCSARPPARTVPATIATTSSRNTHVTSTKRSGMQNSKPKIPATDKKVSKPPVTSSISQYRYTMGTAEERRAKLAEWQASKGKTFKRPAMTKTAPSKPKPTAKNEADLKPQTSSSVEPELTSQCNTKPESELEVIKPDSAAHCADTQGTELTADSLTPLMMNTTLDLLENSDADLLADPQEKVDDIVVNLCDALEAMATPSQCSNELSLVMDECNEMDDHKHEDQCKQEVKNERPEEDVDEQPKADQVKDETEESDDQEVDTDGAEEVESDDGDVMETMTQTEGASVVKYSVKTTPYLQSVKRTIEDEVSTSTSRRKSNIKDLKFLTPVRRSCRIQRKSCHLPKMLADHDPCVSSLAELGQLDDSNAYIYRKNPALLEDLPDQPNQ